MKSLSLDEVKFYLTHFFSVLLNIRLSSLSLEILYSKLSIEYILNNISLLHNNMLRPFELKLYLSLFVG